MQANQANRTAGARPPARGRRRTRAGTVRMSASGAAMSATDSSAKSPGRCFAEIDLDRLRGNAAVCRSLVGADCGILAVVKADAYGHGLARVAAALANSVEWFGVANLAEARRARSAVGEGCGILLLSPALPDEVDAIVGEGFSASVSLPQEVDAFAAAARRRNGVARLHAVVDTGMGRMGSRPEEFLALLERIRRDRHCLLEGVSSHFPSADEDAVFTRDQIARFVELLRETTPGPGCLVHLGNSAGLLGYAAETPFATLVRPGLALYGVSPLGTPLSGVDSGSGAALRPVMRLATWVALVRDLPAGSSVSYGRTYVAPRALRAATLAVGYGDGYPRHLSGSGAEVLVGGRRCPLLGRVTMDQIVVDVSGLGAVSAGDEAVLIGRQGDEEITASELAERAGTIPWEIFTGITARVGRFYRPDS